MKLLMYLFRITPVLICILLQLTYSSVRFGVYEAIRPRLIPKDGGMYGVMYMVAYLYVLHM